MGTRNLTMVQFNNEIKVAQYGQWDGYPSGQGITVLRFCKEENNIAKLREKMPMVSFLNNEGIGEFNRLLGEKDPNALYKFRLFFSRDVCADILNNIIKEDGEVQLHNQFNFGYDGLFCEWAYCVNLDTNKLEVYCGYASCKCLEKTERFYNEFSRDGYYGVKLIKEYDLNNLPDDNIFISELEGKNNG